VTAQVEGHSTIASQGLRAQGGTGFIVIDSTLAARGEAVFRRQLPHQPSRAARAAGRRLGKPDGNAA
jgi:hypothetical protein